ncbi:MAG: B3/B4 domain-containing protein [Bacteroidota bacterium]
MPYPGITFSSEIIEALPLIRAGLLTASVQVTEESEPLGVEMDRVLDETAKELDAEKIRNFQPVKAAKEAYKALGKDPNRYRPAAESLLRRVSKGKGLYRVNNVVDCLNLASVQTGFSICGYDLDKIEGDIELGKGQPREPYEGIGRGHLNIENLPVFRDDKGAFGTPTSDSRRTLIDGHTQKVLMIIPSFDGDEGQLVKALTLLSDFLKRFVEKADPGTKIIDNQ